MHADIIFFANSILLGVGLAMDAFSVSIANGLADPDMKGSRRNLIAGTYAMFQLVMPLIGWICVHTILEHFSVLEKFTPVVALVLLLYIGIKMIMEAVRDRQENREVPGAVLTIRMLMIQGLATSIDALSVGVTFADYSAVMALLAAVIIGIVTYAICLVGLHIGKRVGSHFSDKAAIFGGCILILIGLEIFIRGILL